jgi:hypothetical protein
VGLRDNILDLFAAARLRASFDDDITGFELSERGLHHMLSG